MRVFIFIFGFSLLAKSQDLQKAYEQSVQSFNKEEYEKFHELNLEMLNLHPSHPTILYNTAVSYYKLNKRSSSKQFLEKLISWNSNLNLKRDNLIYKIEDGELLNELENKRKSFKSIVSIGKEALKVFGNYHFEDLIISEGNFYFTDVLNYKIVQVDESGRLPKTLIGFKSSPISVCKGSDKTVAWVSLGNILGEKTTSDTLSTNSCLVKIDLKRGKEFLRVPLPKKAILGDMIVVKNRIIATNSSKPELYIFEIGNELNYKIIEVDDAFNLQGITYEESSDRLFVADYIKGVFFCNLENLNVRNWLKSDTYLLKGIDGLYSIEEDVLVASQNNSTPHRIIKITTANKEDVNIELLENNLPYKGEPTNFYLDDDKGLFYIANSAWPFYDKKMNISFPEGANQTLRNLPLGIIN